MPEGKFLTLSHEGKGEYDEKRSRFLGVAFPARDPEAVIKRVEQIRMQNRDARHICYAYIFRDGSKRYSDDGEPQGTAGRPMLDLLAHKQVFNCAVAVTRYFGGILLGTGGLVRAYTLSASSAVENAGISVMRQFESFELYCSYDKYNRVQALLSQCSGRIDTSDFSDRIKLKVTVPIEFSADFPARLTDATLGESNADTLGIFYAAE